MKKEELVAKGLSEEQAQAVMDAWTEAMKGFVPKERLDEVSGKLKEANATIDTLKKGNADNEELQKQVKEYKEKVTSVTYQNRCQKEDLSENKRVEPGNVGKPRNIKGFPDILILKKALCDINFEKKAEILCYIKVKMENPTLMHRKG